MNTIEMLNENDYSYNTQDSNQHHFYPHLKSINKESYLMTYINQEEKEYYANYDHEMNEAITDANYQDQLCNNEDEEGYDYQNDPLLELIMGVQSYLIEQANIYDGKMIDSPLYNLQYKMHAYMRQRASELGIDF
jgi:hypothetical protein